MGKRKYYFPPKAEKKPITISDDVKEELKKLADKYADDAIKERQTEDLDNYIAFTLEALRRLGWTGKVRLNRFLSVLTTVSEEATNADDPPAYANQIKERFRKIGVKAFAKNDDAAPQLEDHAERKIIRYWGAIGGVCDGTGIGEPLAYHLKELFDRNNDGLVEAYKFKAAGDESKSKLGYLAYDFNHNDLIKVPKAPEDPDQLELWKELRWQVEHLTREAKRQQTINFYVPANAEPRKPGHVPHDDLVMALFLLMRAARNIDPNTGKATAFDREKSGV